MTGSNEPAKQPVPFKEYRVGGVTASIWKNQPDESKRASFGITFKKSYLGIDEQWHDTPNFLPSDLQNLSMAATEAFRHLCVREIERQPENFVEKEEKKNGNARNRSSTK